MPKTPNIETLVDRIHPAMCRCGGRCYGWHADYDWFLTTFQDQFGTAGVLEESLDKWPATERERLMDQCVREGMSLNEMSRSFGFDYRSVRRRHPGYTPFPPGGGGEAQTIRGVNEDLQRLDNTGRLTTRRHRG